MNRNRHWCMIADEMPTTSTETINIINAELKESVTHLRWTWPANIQQMPTVWFEIFPNLESLDISGMGVETMTQNTFKNAGRLKTLIMEDNKIQILSMEIFKIASNLETIEMNNNKISEMEDLCLKGLNKLISLDMSNNRIEKLTRNTLAGAPKLATVTFSANRIHTIEDGAFNLPQLKSLLLDKNNIKTLPINILIGCPLLTDLALNKNAFSEIPAALHQQINIDLLVMDTNPLENAHIRDIFKISTLETVSLEDTGINITMTDADLTTPITTNIDFLDLSKNGIRDTNVLKHLKMLNNLELLVLNGNPLDHIDLDNVKTIFPELVSISMQDTEIDCEWLRNWLPKLKDIEIDIKTGANKQRIKIDNDHFCDKNN